MNTDSKRPVAALFSFLDARKNTVLRHPLNNHEGGIPSFAYWGAKA